MNNILFADAISEIKSNPRLSVIRNPHFKFAQKRFKKTLLPLIAVSSLVLSLLFMTSVRVGTYIQGYSIAKLEQEQNELLSSLQAYKLEEAVLKRPERIRRIATQQLHLIQPSKAPVIRLP
jgi:cell division protein FtsL